MNPELLRFCCPQDDEILGPAGHPAGWIWKLCLSQQHSPLFIFLKRPLRECFAGFFLHKNVGAFCRHGRRVHKSLPPHNKKELMERFATYFCSNHRFPRFGPQCFLKGVSRFFSAQPLSSAGKTKKKKLAPLVWVEQKDRTKGKGWKNKTNLN